MASQLGQQYAAILAEVQNLKELSLDELQARLRPGEDQVELHTVAGLLQQELPPPRWLVKDWLPDGPRVLISGPQKSKKSTLALELAHALSSGQPFLGLYETEHLGSGLVVQEENPLGQFRRDTGMIWRRYGADVAVTLEEMQERFDRHEPQAIFPDWAPGFELPDVDALVGEGMNLEDPAWLTWLWARHQARDYKFLVLDPLYKLFPGHGDVNQPADAAFILNLLDYIRRDLLPGVMLILVHHSTSKHREGGGFTSRVLGSTYFVAWYDTLWFSQVNKDGSLKAEFQFREMPPRDEPAYLDNPELGSWAEGTAPDEKVDGRRDDLKDLLLLPGSDLLAIARDNRAEAVRRLMKQRDWGVSERSLDRDLKEILEELDE